MLWYMMKTWAGGEEALVKEIRRTVPPYLYQEVFVIYNERIWRHQGRSSIQTEPLFRGCVFLTCRETEPLFRRLDKIPAMSRLIATGYLSMFPLMEKDARFLEAISGEDHMIRTSYVLREREGGATYRVSGPLEYLLGNIEKIKFRSRTVKTHKTLWGEDVVIPLGIITNEDLQQKMSFDGLDVSAEQPDHYMTLEVEKDAEGRNRYMAGGRKVYLPKEYGRMTMAG